MNYADRMCTYVEVYDPAGYLYTGKDVFTGTKVTVFILSKELNAYRRGAMIQEAMPSLSIEEREFLISGMYDSFPESEDD